MRGWCGYMSQRANPRPVIEPRKHRSAIALSVICRSMEVRYDLPDFRRRMLAAERRSGNQIFAHRQSADDDGVETNLSDEARRDINSVRVVAGDRNPDEFALPVRVRRQLGIVDRVKSANDMRARQQFRRR